MSILALHYVFLDNVFFLNIVKNILDQKLLVIIKEFFLTLNEENKQNIILRKKEEIGLFMIEKILHFLNFTA